MKRFRRPPTSTRQAVRLIRPGVPLELRDVPVPVPGTGEVLVRVHAAGICDSDVHYRAGISPTRPPVTLGHEVAGTVEHTGESVSPIICCRSCRAHRRPPDRRSPGWLSRQ